MTKSAFGLMMSLMYLAVKEYDVVIPPPPAKKVVYRFTFSRHGLCLVLLFLTPQLRGQAAEKTTGGAGFELNTISLVGAAGGLILYGGYNLSSRFVLGFKFGVSSDLRRMNSVEGTAFFRWYYYKRGTLDFADSGQVPRLAFFVQAGAGAGVYAGFLDPLVVRPSALGEAAAGLRIYFRQDLFFEPFVRCAYPSGFGVGFTFGG